MTVSIDSVPASFWRRRPIVVLSIALAAIAGIALLAGFVVFAAELPEPESRLSARAEGIVALTGDAARVREAVALLAAGRANRLLISGVNRTTTRSEIASLVPGYGYLFQCCIDLGYKAMNTAGNAEETRRWAEREGFRRSLIVVTSTYHMPRALVEMGAALPGVSLVPFPVATPRINGRTWWKDLPSLRLLGLEYLKYLFAIARVMLEGEKPLKPARSAALRLA